MGLAVQRWWFWAVYINPVFWSINGLVGTQLGDVQETMTLQNGGTTQVWPNTFTCHFSAPCNPAVQNMVELCVTKFGGTSENFAILRLWLYADTQSKACVQGASKSQLMPRSLLQVAAYIKQHFGFEYSMRGWIVLILLGFVVVFRVCAIIGVTKLTFVKR